MSRIGKMAIDIPERVSVDIRNSEVEVKGVLASLSQPLHRLVSIYSDSKRIELSPKDDSPEANALTGTFRAILFNMVAGVSLGFQKKLTLHGVGSRAQVDSNTLNLQIGFSHPVSKAMPFGITVTCPTPTEIIISGVNKQVVGQIASEIRSLRPPEPYKGKGIRYFGEQVLLKETKKK